jgi:hypothetical protein
MRECVAPPTQLVSIHPRASAAAAALPAIGLEAAAHVDRSR